ncbi:MAG TPA: branched-chain amino acid ABC transporter substrate-binding protein [Solirubrobacterales bacterium]|nr:branched-chain amino acid ABC transporter substrate-binding protein [Solirubrobacterales bacterium]
MSLRLLKTSSLAALLLGALVVFVLGGNSDAAAPAASAVGSSACGPLQYGGKGDPEALVVSDLPLQGDSKQRSLQMNDAIRLVLEGANWQAGGVKVGFQACDDSNAKTGLWTKAQCQANAKAYAANPSVLGVIGTYNSGCAEVMIPILSQAPGGGVAMVSPGNTLICLTQSSPSCGKGEPKSLYPGRRNYARVVPNDAYQGAGLASFARKRGVKDAYVLYAGKDPTSLGQAKTFRGAARKLGIDVVGFKAWNVNASSYRGLMGMVADATPDAVLLAGLTESNGARLIKDKVAVLGPNSGVELLAPDGFAQQSTIDLAGKASKGMFASVPGQVPQNLTGPGAKLVDELEKDLGGPVELYAPYAGQAASVVLDAIGKGRDRTGTIDAVRSTSVRNGITGSFEILPSGDPSVGPITVSVARKTFVPFQVVEPGPSLVKAARHG